MHVKQDSPDPERTPVRWVAVLAEAQLADGTAKEQVVEGNLIAIFHHDGQIYAVDALCAHHGGPLAEGMVNDGCVTCPWHGWQYRLCDGTQLSSGAKLIESYPVRRRDGQIEVGLFA
jgi:nitrite reductase/ring-hydroxylating ferredoxin subunit